MLFGKYKVLIGSRVFLHSFSAILQPKTSLEMDLLNLKKTFFDSFVWSAAEGAIHTSYPAPWRQRFNTD